MPLRIIQNDITAVRADAAVIPAGREPVCGTGIDKIIYDAADSGRLLAAREKIGVIEPGNAAVTRSGGLPSRYLIYTAVPVWQGGCSGELDNLRSCYRESLRLALKLMCKTVAVPLFPPDGAGYPGDKVIETAFFCFREFLAKHEMELLLLVNNQDMPVLPEAAEAELAGYIRRKFREETVKKEYYLQASAMLESDNACEDDSYELDLPDMAPSAGYFDSMAEYSVVSKEQAVPRDAAGAAKRKQIRESASYNAPQKLGRGHRRAGEALTGSLFPRDAGKAPQQSLSYVMTQVGENFREMLLRLIDEKGLSDPYVYKRANLDRKLFSKIRCNPDYCPSRKTVIALSIALELTLDETSDLLSRAGYAFSPGSKADLIVEFCILNKIYDIFEVDMLLFKYGQPTLG